MFAVIFEVQPKAEKFNDYLDLAKFLKPKLESIEGFIDNERFESKRTKGRVLSLSTWADEKAVIRWRTQGEHHGVQEKGRSEVFEDYHLRVGEITADTGPPKGVAVRGSASTQRRSARPSSSPSRSSSRGRRAHSAQRPISSVPISACAPARTGSSIKRYSRASTIPVSCCCSPAGGMPRLPRHGRQRNPTLPRHCATATFASSATMGCSIAARRRSSIPT
jgi:heme-degrading monooxygenase HmoA